MKKLAIWFASLSLLGLCTAGPALAATNYAVCVGVNDYNSQYCSNGLEGCVPDAQHMTNLITSRGEWLPANVQFIKNSNATRTNLRQAISNAAKKAVSGDHFLYYHSSHGGNDNYYFTTNSGKVYLHYGLDSNGVKNYICSYDADYTAKMMATDLSAFKAGVKIVIMMDTCHSAGMFKYNATTSSRKALAAKLAEAADAADDSSDDGEVAEEPAPENSAAGFFMQAVLDQLQQIEADQVRRGLRPRTAASLATDVGWIAAADYDQYSWDGSSGGAFTEAFINGVTNKNKMCDNATYGNQDGYASFYEGWNYAKDIARGQRSYDAWDYDSDYGYYDYIWTDAQCTNTTVLNAVLVGWAGTNRPAANIAPTFPSATATASGVVGGDVEYTFSASGSSPITYTLSTSVSSSLYDFENGYLVFQPAAAGTYTFTCTAANGNTPNATCVLTVTVTEPPPATPEVPSTPPSASTTSFTATWNAVSDAASYKLYVQQKVVPSTSARAARGSSILSESFSSFTANANTDISGSLNNYTATGGWTGSKVYSDSGRAKLGASSSSGWIATPAIDLPAGAVVSCTIAKYNDDTGTVTISLSTDGGSTWSALGDAISPTSGGDTYERTVASACTGAKIKFASSSKRFYLDDVSITGSSDTWEDIPGSPFTVSGTSKTVSGLSSGTGYRYSVAAVNAAGVESEPSAYVTVETAEGNSAPVISVPQTFYSLTLGDGHDVGFNVTASGFPEPDLLLSTTAADEDYEFFDGAFLFAPSVAGTFTFVFTASNSEGSDSVTVTVEVSPAPVTVPALIVDETTDTTADVYWTECAGVTTYTLQLASDDQFTTGGSGANVLESDFSDTTGWTLSGTGQYTGAGYCGAGVPSIKFDGNGDYAISPDFGSGTKLQFWAYGNGGSGSTFAISGLVNGSWQEIETVSIAQGGDTYEVTLPSGTSQVRFDFTKSVNCALDDVVVSGPSGGGSLIAEYSVSDTEFTFTGLSCGTLYYARVRGNAGWSNIGELRTDDVVLSDTAPSWSATFPATGTVDVGYFYTLSNVSSYVTGSPAPAITLGAPAGLLAELEDDTFTFGAEASGSYTFTFTASNSAGTATATLVVTAVAQAPVWSTLPAMTINVGTNGNINLSDYVSGAPAPTIILTATTADAADYEFEDGYLVFAPPDGGTYTFTFTAANGISPEAVATLTVTAVAQAPDIAPLDPVHVTLGGTGVAFTVSATGNPAPTFSAFCSAALLDSYQIDENTGYFTFEPVSAGVYIFNFFATNSAGSDTKYCTITVSAAAVTVPTLTVTDVTDTTALATWAACDGVSSYTLQLATNDFPAASGSARSAIPILSEDFSGFSGNGTADIGNSLDGRTAITGWTGSKVYTASETVKVGASSGQGWLMTPALDASGTLTVVWSTYRYGTSDKDTLLLGVSENGTDFDEETITLGDEMTGYTNTFTVTGPTVYVRWMASGSSKARFYLDDVHITNPGGGSGGAPASDDIQEFTVAGTSHTFTNLTPFTVYYARVKGDSYWSNVEEFITDESAIPPQPLADFEQWLIDHDAAGADADDLAGDDEHTFYQYYIADIDPYSPSFLAIQISDLSAGTFTIPAASANRNYTLRYTTDLSTGEYQQQDIGAGNPETAIPFPVDGDWYGGLQVTLPDNP